MNESPSPSKPQVLAITLNPALDHTLEVEALRPGEVNRALRMQVDVGGKGFNVASCLADFGIATAVTGLLGRDNAAPFEASWRAKGIADHCLRLEGLTRVNTKVVDHRNGQTTDLNLPGPTLDAGTRERLLGELMERMDALMDTVRWVVLAGSLPPGWPEATYRILADHVHQAGGKVILDASGPALAAGLLAAPDIVKPNRNELAELQGAVLGDIDAVVSAARSLLAGPQAPQIVVISMGEEGALFLDREQTLLAHPPQVKLISTVGAGDAMVAGILASQLTELPLSDCARLATAFSASKLAQLGPHLPSPTTVRALAGAIRITERP